MVMCVSQNVSTQVAFQLKPIEIRLSQRISCPLCGNNFAPKIPQSQRDDIDLT